MSKDSKFKVTLMQTQALCTFFEENPEVIRGYKKTSECIDAVQNKWMKITKKLNTLGPTRDHKAWAKYLCDMKAKLKRKHIRWKKNKNGTGHVMCNTDDFNEIKLRMLQVLRRYPTATKNPHVSRQPDLDTDNAKLQKVSISSTSPQESPNISNDSIDQLDRYSADYNLVFIDQIEFKDFEALGRHIAQHLRTMPLPVALETKEMLLSVLRKQHGKFPYSNESIVDPLNKL